MHNKKTNKYKLLLKISRTSGQTKKKKKHDLYSEKYGTN